MKKIWIIIAMVLFLTPLALAFSGSSTNYKLYYGIDGMGLAQGNSADYKIRSNLLYQPIGKYNSASYKLYLGPYYISLTSVSNPPVITIIYPQNRNYSTMSIWANITLDKDGSWCGRSLDGQANVTMTNSSGNWNNRMRNGTTDLTDGPHTVRFYCNDTTGSMGTNTMNFYSCLSDVTGQGNVLDRTVNMRDIGYISGKFGATPSSPNWDPNADLTGPTGDPDGVVNMRDVGLATSRFGKTCP